jgi:hypothetical protein
MDEAVHGCCSCPGSNAFPCSPSSTHQTLPSRGPRRPAATHPGPDGGCLLNGREAPGAAWPGRAPARQPQRRQGALQAGKGDGYGARRFK